MIDKDEWMANHTDMDGFVKSLEYAIASEQILLKLTTTLFEEYGFGEDEFANLISEGNGSSTTESW